MAVAFLFEIEDGRVAPTTEALLISPFKEIWERDETDRREIAKLELTYIEFMSSKKKTNPFKGYDESIRGQKIKESITGFPEGWEADELVEKGIDFILKLQKEASATYNFYASAYNGARKLQDFFNDFDMNELNPKNGMPLYKPRDITSALKDTEEVLQKMTKLEKKVEEDLFDKTVTKANKEISPFADPNMMM